MAHGRATDTPALGDRVASCLWVGQVLSTLGSQVSFFVIPTIAITYLHASEGDVGLLNAVGSVAFPVLYLVAGPFVGRWRLLRVMYASDLARAGAFAVIPIAVATGHASMSLLYGVALVSSVFSVLFDLAYSAVLPRLVGGEKLQKQNGRLQLAFTMARLVGPPIGGLMVRVAGVVASLMLNSLSFVASVISVVIAGRIVPGIDAPADVAGRLTRSDLVSGFDFLWQIPILRRATIASSLHNLGMSAARTALLLFLYRGLDLSAAEAGLLIAAEALGATVGATRSTQVIRRLGVGGSLLLGPLESILWLLIPVAAIGHGPALIAIILFVSAIWLPIWNITITTLRQEIVPPDMLVRVHAASRTLVLGTIPIGSLLGGIGAGLLASRFGDLWGLAIAVALGALVASTALQQLANRDLLRVKDYADCRP